MPSQELLKQQKRLLVRRHATPDNGTGLWQVANTLLPLGALGWAAIASQNLSLWLTAALTAGISLMMVRVFALMHECGHGSLCRSRWLNQSLGFVFGVLSGMPQYVWSQHHDHHHRTNGNWDKYRGPLSTLSTDEFEAMTERQRRNWLRARHIALAPLGGFVYLIFNPRFNWLKGLLGWMLHGLRGGWRRSTPAFRTRYWRTRREFWHMTANNLVLLSLWALLTASVGAAEFFSVYLASVSVAGGVGIALFTVQHNFDMAYAARDDDWDIDRGALQGTSFLILPGWLNWITANIAFHHIHHLSAAIPGYRLPQCHAENAALFASVKRITLREIPVQLGCLLWDRHSQRIISADAYSRQLAGKARAS